MDAPIEVTITIAVPNVGTAAEFVHAVHKLLNEEGVPELALAIYTLTHPKHA